MQVSTEGRSGPYCLSCPRAAPAIPGAASSSAELQELGQRLLIIERALCALLRLNGHCEPAFASNGAEAGYGVGG